MKKAFLAMVLVAAVGLVASGAMASQSEDGKCIVASTQTIGTTWKTVCSVSMPKFPADPGNGVTVFDIDASTVTLDMTNGAGMGLAYQMVENCGGYVNDPHAIASADLANFSGVTAPMPVVGVLHPAGDPLGAAACTVNIQARVYGGTGTSIDVLADQDHAVSGVDDQTAFHIVAYTTN